jgi:hypothetical protein
MNHCQLMVIIELLVGNKRLLLFKNRTIQILPLLSLSIDCMICLASGCSIYSYQHEKRALILPKNQQSIQSYSYPDKTPIA